MYLKVALCRKSRKDGFNKAIIYFYKGIKDCYVISVQYVYKLTCEMAQDRGTSNLRYVRKCMYLEVNIEISL